MQFQHPKWAEYGKSPVPENDSLEEYLSARSKRQNHPRIPPEHFYEGYCIRVNGKWYYIDDWEWGGDSVKLVVTPINSPKRSESITLRKNVSVEAINPYPEDLSYGLEWCQVCPAPGVEVLVSDPETHEDLIAACIATATEDLAREYLRSDIRPPIYERQNINEGFCNAVATEVLKRAGEAGHPTERLEVMSHNSMSTIHYWLRYEDQEGRFWHFDAEAPWGVRDWRDLPIMFRESGLKVGEPAIETSSAADDGRFSPADE